MSLNANSGTKPEVTTSFQITPAPIKGYSFFGNTNSVTSFSPEDLSEISRQFTETASVADSAKAFAQASARSGGAVIIASQFGCLPMIVGRDGEPVLMYKFVEVLHELVSLAQIQQELPSLSYRQIEGGITFLRALTQFNIRGLDIDAEEERMLEASPEFQQRIKDALNLEPTRVFTFEQQAM